MTTYRSLTNGFYSTPDNKGHPVSWRSNNPGAVNGALWERSEPGYVTEIKYDGKNNTTVFETPEHGVAVYYKLLQKYRNSGARTVHDIIWRYGGGQANYTTYATQVSKWTGFPESKEIVLSDDSILLPFAKAMFRYEAGKANPWSDAQIMYGFRMARGDVAEPAGELKSQPGTLVPTESVHWLVALFRAIFGRK